MPMEWARNAILGQLVVALMAVGMLGCEEAADGSLLDDVTLPDGVELPDGLDLDSLVLPPGDTTSEFGDFGEPCEKDEDCESEICIPGPLGQSVCSQGCEDECPPGWLCTEYTGDSELLDFVCIPGLVNQCAQCTENVECGGKIDQCTPIGEEGLSFCTQHCDVSEDCNDGYYCSPPGAGTGSQQCLPVTGECACPPDVDGTNRPCQVTNTIGVCYGIETCDGPFGWTGCTASTPEVESCDGIDNDCDGKTDEDLPTDATCTVDSPQGSCPGVMTCVDGKGVCEAATPTAEVCDGVDNDCNGKTDDGLNSNTPCSIDNENGSCTGVLSCVGGVEACNAATPSAETCDGVDNNCDGKTDNDLTQACTNDCGDAGTSECLNGAFTECNAPTPEEICDDGLDNDCDGNTDEPDCAKGLAEIGASLTFYSSYFHASNIVTDHGDGTYSQSYFGMTDPNANGTAWAKVDLSSLNTSPLPWFVAAKPGESIQCISASTDLYDDRPDTVLMAAIRDAKGRPVNKGLVISFDVSANAGVGALSCTTDDFGRCKTTLTLPDTAFDSDQDITVTATGGGISSDPITISTHARPAPMELDLYQVGIELPVSPLWDGSQQQQEFDAKVYINTGDLIIGAYDLQVSFDNTLLETVSVTAGSHPLIYGNPISNVGEVADTEGKIKFNTLNSQANNPDGKGAKVHVATIRFRTLSTFFANMSAAFSGKVTSLYSTDFAPLSPMPPQDLADIQFHGANGQGTSASLDSQITKVEGLFVSSPKSQLMAWYPLTGENESTTLKVIGLRTDGAELDLSQDTDTVYLSSNSTLLQVGSNGTIESQSPSATFDDWVDVSVSHGEHSVTQPIRVLVLGGFEISVTDDELQPIAGHPTNLGQTSKLTVTGTWYAGSQAIAKMDITSMTSVIPNPGLIYKPILREFSATADGPHPFEVRGAVGNVLAEDVITVNSITPATINGLRIVAPCSAENLSLTPSTINLDTGTAELTVSIEARLQGIGSTCQTQVWADFDDGASMRLTGDPAITVSVDDTTIATTTSAGKLTASTAGTATISAVLFDQDTEVAKGQRIFEVTD